MKTSQTVEKNVSYVDYKEILIKKIEEIAESDQLARIDIERHLAEAERENIVKNSGHIICDLTDDSKALEITVSLLYHKIRMETLIKKIEKSKRRFDNKKEELNCYLWDRYNMEDGTDYFFDYCKLRIIEGISPSKRQVIEDMLCVATKLINSSAEQLSILSQNTEELNDFEKDLIELLVSPEGRDLKATYEKLLQMNREELQNFIQKERRKPVSFMARMLKNLRTS